MSCTVRLSLPDGTNRKVQCDEHTCFGHILQAVSAKMDERGQDAHRELEPARLSDGTQLIWQKMVSFVLVHSRSKAGRIFFVRSHVGE